LLTTRGSSLKMERIKYFTYKYQLCFTEICQCVHGKNIHPQRPVMLQYCWVKYTWNQNISQLKSFKCFAEFLSKIIYTGNYFSNWSTLHFPALCIFFNLLLLVNNFKFSSMSRYAIESMYKYSHAKKFSGKISHNMEGKETIFTFEGGSCRSHYAESPIWKRLWICRKTDY